MKIAADVLAGLIWTKSTSRNCVESICESKDGVHFIGKNMHLV
jgi:hypothetical protein